MKILYFAPIPYDEIKQRPQHIAEEFSKNNEVWYVEPTISGMRCLIKLDNKFKKKRQDINPNLHVLRLNGLLSLHPKLFKWDPHCISHCIEYLQLKRLIDEVDVIWIGYELWYRLFRNLRKTKLLVFDKMDDNVQLEKNLSIKKEIDIWNRKLERDADIIFVTAQKFYEKLTLKRNGIYLLPNGVDEKWKGISYSSFRHTDRIIIGYIGMISHWFDINTITKLAESRPDIDIILVGPNYLPQINLKNVKYIGEVPKSEVPKWINIFDICLYPFKKDELLDTIDPVKIYEYLMFNKPIVAIDSVEIRKYGNKIYSYKTFDELILHIREKLNPPFKTEEERKEFFENNTWIKRAESAENILCERIKNNEKSNVSIWN